MKALLSLQQLFTCQCMMIVSSVLRLGKSGLPLKPMSDDDADRIGTCVKLVRVLPAVHCDLKSSFRG